MKIGVIGYGVVGTATAEVLQRLGHKIITRDTNPDRVQAAQRDGFDYFDENMPVDALFICVPETRAEEALASAPVIDITVLRSTVPPGTTDRLSEKFGRPLTHMPEFLKEATALWDALNPPFILIGCRNEEHGQRLSEIFTPLMAPIMLVSPSTSEMVKLVLNAYLHTLISFWNEIHLVCKLTNVESHVVGKLCTQDRRVSSYGATMHGKPAGGRCLPKDIIQLIAFAEGNGHEPEFLKAVKRMNEIIGNGTLIEKGEQLLNQQVLELEHEPIFSHKGNR